MKQILLLILLLPLAVKGKDLSKAKCIEITQVGAYDTPIWPMYIYYSKQPTKSINELKELTGALIELYPVESVTFDSIAQFIAHYPKDNNEPPKVYYFYCFKIVVWDEEDNILDEYTTRSPQESEAYFSALVNSIQKGADSSGLVKTISHMASYIADYNREMPEESKVK